MRTVTMHRVVFGAVAFLAAGAALADGIETEQPRMPDGRPDLSGVWQTLNTAHWNLEPHVSGYPVLLELGAQFAVPPGQGVVVGGSIPYLREALAERDRRFANRLTDDPEGKCFLGGIPRSTYMPYPFQILQNEDDVVINYQFGTGVRRIFVNGNEEAPLDSWMGWSNGRWDGDSFVVKAGPRFELVRTNPLGEPITASAAVAVGRLYIRGEQHLFAIGATPAS